jgi:hypothetical protein
MREEGAALITAPGSILRSLLLSAHKREEEERGEQRKKRYEKGHDRSMFLN